MAGKIEILPNTLPVDSERVDSPLHDGIWTFMYNPTKLNVPKKHRAGCLTKTLHLWKKIYRSILACIGETYSQFVMFSSRSTSIY